MIEGPSPAPWMADGVRDAIATGLVFSDLIKPDTPTPALRDLIDRLTTAVRAACWFEQGNADA